MTEVVTSIATELAKCLWDPISRHARYLFCSNQFIKEIERAKEELEVTLADVNKRKEEAGRRTEELMPSVKKWLDDVNAILQEVQKLKQELEGRKNKCFNVSLRYSLAKQMDDNAKQMKDLKSNSHFEQFSQLIELPGISTQFSSKEIMDFKSRKSTYNSLLEAIKDGKNKIVGLYGMGGSGKTTLAIEVGKEVQQLKLFEKVIKVVVSRPPNVRNIQEEIKGKAGLKFEENTESTIAERLFLGLKSMKILFILDDVWSNLNLQEIGIPLNENCCILLTTRLRDVCESMRCEITFELSLLTGEEAWTLLKMHANVINDSLKEFDDVGNKIVDECKGLPIAVVTVGSALRGKGIIEWKSILRRLQHSVPLDIDESSRGPFACLKLSYDNLPSLAKQLFLLCSMFPEDHEIHTEDLIRFSKGTLEFENIVHTIEDARNEILVSINSLLDSCLLMHTDKQACIKMHDLVRDVALWIAKKQHQAILVDSHAVSRTVIENETLKETKAISLWNLENNFKLSNQLRCPALEILLLHPKGFVEDLGGIEALKVLALVTSSFKWAYYYQENIQWSVPQSIVPSLINVHTLCFRGIALGDVSFLSELKRLEILDLRCSKFDELPGGIVDLKKLKLLDVFGCEIGKSPFEVIGKCVGLEELYFWDDNSAIPKNFSLSRLKRYVIYDSTCRYISECEHYPSEYLDGCEEPLGALRIQGFKESDLNFSMKGLILRAQCLWLENCWWDHKEINVKIKHLLVLNCPQKRFIVDRKDTSLQTGQVFPRLITLTLIEMNSLEQVFQDSSVTCSLPMLQELSIETCPELPRVFPHGTDISLPKLRKLRIYGCKKVKCLFSHLLASHCPSLVELQIGDCSELERLVDEEVVPGDRVLHQRESHHDLHDYSHGNESERAFVVVTAKSVKQLQNQKALAFFQSLKDVRIGKCGRRNKGIFEVQVRGTLEGEGSTEAQEEPLKVNLELRNLWLERLAELEYIWKGPTQSVSLQRLGNVELYGCLKLRNVFSIAVVTSLPELRTLSVFECEEFEGIFCEKSLKNLSSSSSSNVCFPKLEKIQIWDCNKVKRLFSYSMASHCPSLVELKIDYCSELERLVDEEVATGDRVLHQRESHHDLHDYSHGNESERAFVVVTAKSVKQLQNQKALAFFQSLKDVHIRKFGRRNKGIFEVQVRGTLEGEGSSEAQEEPLKLNLELCYLWLEELAELEYIWKGPTQSVSLQRLESVRLYSCTKLRNIFTIAVVTSLLELKSLTVSECEEFEGIFCEESLKNLSSSSSSNVCFPKLEEIQIWDCNKVKRLFSYSMASHCPSLKRLSIWNCSQLEGIVQHYEDEVSGPYEMLFPKLNDLALIRLAKLREIYPGYELNHLSDKMNIQDCPNIYNISL